MGKEQWSVEELCDTLNKTAATDKDNINAIDGGTGVGKSTLAFKLCKRGCEWFDMDKDILYSRKELIDWATTARPGSWGFADEAVNVLFKRDFQKGEQKFLLKVLDMCRSRNLTLFLLIPNFWALDKHVLEGRIRLRLHVAKTGLTFLWKPSGNPFTPDKWCRKYNEKVCYNWDSYPNARKTKGFLGYLKFGDMGVDEKRRYLEIKERKKLEVKAQEEAEERAEDEAKKKSVELGKWLALEFVDRRRLLRIGWQAIWAEAQGITRQAVNQHLKIFRTRGNLLSSESNTVKNNILYNNNTTSDKSEEDKEELNNIP